MNETENWKVIPGYSRYKVLPGKPGCILSMNYMNTGKKKKLVPYLEKSGHYRIWVYDDNGLHKFKRLHELIYLAFNGEIPKGFIVHHIDHKPSNNIPSNLELKTRSKHMKEEHSESIRKAIEKSAEVHLKPVLQFDKNGNFIKEFPSFAEAAIQVNGHESGISHCCSGKHKTAYGFVWRYKSV